MIQIILICAALLFPTKPATADTLITDDNFLLMPTAGAHGLRILSPDLLELTLITTKAPDPFRPEHWDFIGKDSHCNAPALGQFVVTVGGKNIAVKKVGFRRRPIYAPLKK